jgi:lysophospholipase L1-like esterase
MAGLWLVLLSAFGTPNPQTVTFNAHEPQIQYIGRVDLSHYGAARLSWSGTAIRARFEGKVCQLLFRDLVANSSRSGFMHINYYNVLIDNDPVRLIGVKQGKEIYDIEGLKEGIHTITIFKRTEASCGMDEFGGFVLAKGKKLLPPPPRLKRRIEFIGDSNTAGYGNEGKSASCDFSPETQNNYLAYGAIVARKFKAEYVCIARSGIGVYRNAAGQETDYMARIYGKTNYQDRLDSWNFANWEPQAVVINLGVNDFFKGKPDKKKWTSNYLALVKRVREMYPDAHIFCIKAPYNAKHQAQVVLKTYIQQCVNALRKKGDKKIYAFATAHANWGQYGAGCDGHPSLREHRIMADQLTVFMKSKMKW